MAQDTWKIRRRFMFAAVIFCMITIGYVLITGQDTTPAETAVAMAFTTIISVTGGYVFGAAWEDINKNKGE